VLVILVPSLAVSVGLVLLSVALMRYLRYLKRSHDAIHLTVRSGWLQPCCWLLHAACCQVACTALQACCQVAVAALQAYCQADCTGLLPGLL